MDLRAATSGDIDAIVALENASLAGQAWSRASLELVLGSAIVVEESDGTLSGYALVRMSGELAELDRIAVHPQQRGSGLGQYLVHAVMEAAAERGAAAVLLEVAHNNHSALRLYADCGFTEIDRRSDYYADGIDAIVMQRQLADAAVRATLEE